MSFFTIKVSIFTNKVSIFSIKVTLLLKFQCPDMFILKYNIYMYVYIHSFETSSMFLLLLLKAASFSGMNVNGCSGLLFLYLSEHSV